MTVTVDAKWVIYAGRRVNDRTVELSVTNRRGRRFRVTVVRRFTDLESLRSLLALADPDEGRGRRIR